MRYTFDKEGAKKWVRTAENEPVPIATQGGAKPFGCYVLPNKAGVVLVLSKRIFIYNYDLTEHKEVIVQKLNASALFFSASRSAFV